MDHTRGNIQLMEENDWEQDAWEQVLIRWLSYYKNAGKVKIIW